MVNENIPESTQDKFIGSWRHCVLSRMNRISFGMQSTMSKKLRGQKGKHPGKSEAGRWRCHGAETRCCEPQAQRRLGLRTDGKNLISKHQSLARRCVSCTHGHSEVCCINKMWRYLGGGGGMGTALPWKEIRLIKIELQTSLLPQTPLKSKSKHKVGEEITCLTDKNLGYEDRIIESNRGDLLGKRQFTKDGGWRSANSKALSLTENWGNRKQTVQRHCDQQKQKDQKCQTGANLQSDKDNPLSATQI